MDFTTMGTVNSYVRQKNLMFAKDYKIRTGQRVVDANGNLNFAKPSMFDSVLESQKKSDDVVSAEKIANIKRKLMSGKKLSQSEMSYLREKDPGTYKKAKHAEQAREELESDLKRAKTKNEARQAVTRAMIKASAEASAELAAYKSGMSAAAGGANAAVNAGANLPTSGENISGSEISTGAGENPEVAQVNPEVSATGENAGEVDKATQAEIDANKSTAETLKNITEEISKSTNAPKVDEKNSGNKKTTADDILEKFLMTIRALEDEWANFTNSDEYKELPEDIGDEKKSGKKSKIPDAPGKKIIDAILTYRATATAV